MYFAPNTLPPQPRHPKIEPIEGANHAQLGLVTDTRGTIQQTDEAAIDPVGPELAHFFRANILLQLREEENDY